MDDAAPPRRGAILPSLVAATGILVYLVLVTSIFSAVDRFGDAFPRSLDSALIGIAQSLVLFVTLAGACFLSFWLIAPIRARLSFASVIVRVLAAAGVAFVVLVPIEFAISSVMFSGTTVVPDTGGLYDLSYPAIDGLEVFGVSVKEAFGTALSRLPVITIAALALWWWLRRKESTHGEA